MESGVVCRKGSREVSFCLPLSVFDCGNVKDNVVFLAGNVFQGAGKPSEKITESDGTKPCRHYECQSVPGRCKTRAGRAERGDRGNRPRTLGSGRQRRPDPEGNRQETVADRRNPGESGRRNAKGRSIIRRDEGAHPFSLRAGRYAVCTDPVGSAEFFGYGEQGGLYPKALRL